jgi:hypothetical protein
MEMIQNSDDNQYYSEQIPQIEFKITDESLIVVNNESGFLEENVWALCSIGRSSKTKASATLAKKE